MLTFFSNSFWFLMTWVTWSQMRMIILLMIWFSLSQFTLRVEGKHHEKLNKVIHIMLCSLLMLSLIITIRIYCINLSFHAITYFNLQYNKICKLLFAILAYQIKIAML